MPASKLTKDQLKVRVSSRINILSETNSRLLSRMTELDEKELPFVWKRVVRRQKAITLLTTYLTELLCDHKYNWLCCDDDIDYYSCKECAKETYMICPDYISTVMTRDYVGLK